MQTMQAAPRSALCLLIRCQTYRQTQAELQGVHYWKQSLLAVAGCQIEHSQSYSRVKACKLSRERGHMQVYDMQAGLSWLVAH